MGRGSCRSAESQHFPAFGVPPPLFKALAAKAGVKMKEIYWTLGHYDIVTIVEAPDTPTATSLGLAVASLGNVRTETLTAFSAEEFGKILGRMP